VTEKVELSQKREEIKRQLAAGEYRTLIDVILDGTGRLIQKLTRRPEPPSFWFSMVAITLFYVSITVFISMLVGDTFETLISFLGGVEYMLLFVVSAVGLAIAIVMGYKIYIGAVFKTLHNHLLDAIELATDLVDLQRWLVALCNVKRTFFFSLTFGIVFGVYGLIVVAPIMEGFIGFGPLIMNMILDFQLGMMIYFLFLFLTLPIRLSRYQFKLYVANPSSSEVIDHLSDLLSNFVYLTAVVAALGALILAFSGLLTLSIIITSVLMLWGPLIVLFIINQYALSKIITRAKWRKLNEVQAKIEALETQEDIPSEKTLGHLGKLMDYHDRIKATPNSALDLRAGLNFLNSLLIPLLAFILANLDKVLDLFS
jgi:hypothetical protein